MTEPPQLTGNYRVFTRRFDQVILASAMPTTPSSERAWTMFMDQTLERRTAWELQGLELAERIRASVAREDLTDTLVTLLVDHSGSMRGERMLLTAAAVDAARAFLAHLGVDVEILGFTTRSWKGGWSRRWWRWTGRRKNPGRLCDLLHIVYEPVGARKHPGSGLRTLAHMLNPNLLKENVDGEAILWAASRQAMQPHGRKAIVVISDGAPVDDSTLDANGPNFLMDHLEEVIASLEVSHRLMQLKIGRDEGNLFPLNAEVEALSEVGATLFELLGRLILTPRLQNAQVR